MLEPGTQAAERGRQFGCREEAMEEFQRASTWSEFAKSFLSWAELSATRTIEEAALFLTPLLNAVMTRLDNGEVMSTAA